MIVVFAFSLALAAPSDLLVVDCIAAVVNKSIVLSSEIEAMLDQMMEADPLPQGADVKLAKQARREEILDGLIAEKLLDEEVKKLRVDVTDAEVDRVVGNVMNENHLDAEKFKLALARQGLSLEEYREGLKKQLTKMKIIQLKVKQRVQVSDTDVNARVAQVGMMNSMEFRVKARHVLVLVPEGSDGKAAHEKILSAKARLEKGEAFDAVAKEVSEDPGSKDRGGSLGEFGRGEMVQEFERAAFTAEPGKLTGPIKTVFGWHLILVDARVPIAKPGDQEIQNKIREQLFGQEVELQFRAYLEDLRKNAHIEKRASCRG